MLAACFANNDPAQIRRSFIGGNHTSSNHTRARPSSEQIPIRSRSLLPSPRAMLRPISLAARSVTRVCAAQISQAVSGGGTRLNAAATATSATAPAARLSLSLRRAFSTDAGSSSASSSSSASPLPPSSLCLVVPVGSKGPPRSVLRLVSRSLSKPSSNQLLVRVSAAAVNPIDNMMCEGYGRALITLAQSLRHPAGCSSAAAADAGADDEAAAEGITLGREGVGIIVALGSNIWGSASPSSRSLALGDRVWFSPRIVDNAGSFSEYCSVGLGEISRAPANLPDPEAAAFPFAICTAWTALVDCAGVVPAALPLAARKFAPSLRGGQPAHSASALNVLRNVGLDPRKVTGALQNLSSLPLVSHFASKWWPVSLREDAPRRAVVHGASGPVGLAAVQLLQLWGYDVWATTIAATRSSLDSLAAKQAAEAPQRNADPDAPVLGALHIVDTALEPLSSLSPRSFSLLLDGVGGEDVMETAFNLLAPSGQMVTLRGEGVKAIDREGLVQGSIKGGSSLAACNARAAEFGCGYHWAISTPNADALEYVGALISAHQWHTNLLPIAMWRGGLAEAADALQAAEDEARQSVRQRPRHVVIIHEGEEKKQ